MTKIFWLLAVSALCFTLSASVSSAQPGNMHRQYRGELRDTLELRQRMHEVHKQMIAEDEELQEMIKQVQELQQRIRERIQQKLDEDPEFQNMKEEWESRRREWQEKNPGTMRPEVRERIHQWMLQRNREK